jgi:hypothetical protein
MSEEAVRFAGGALRPGIDRGPPPKISRSVRPEAAELPITPAAPGSAATKELRPWPVIWIVGGAVWLVVTCLVVIWLRHWSGTRVEETYMLSTTGLAVKHVAVFLLAVVCYRIVIAMGWPDPWPARLRVLLVNALLVLGILVWSEVVDDLAAGFIDGQVAEMNSNLHMIFYFLWVPHWFISLLLHFFTPYALGLCAILLTLVINRRHTEAVQAAELASAYANTRMVLLSAQLQPHFLFNSLNALTELIEENPRKASAMVVQLGNFLRHALESGQAPWVTLATELAGLQTYLDIQRVRFGDAVLLSTEVSPEALGIQVPSLVLQPLVENAIEHGRRQRGPTLGVSIVIGVNEQHLLIRVANTRPRIPATLPPQAYGRGLSNVALRLRVAYGDAAQLSLDPGSSGGTVATLLLPLRRGAAFRELPA